MRRRTSRVVVLLASFARQAELPSRKGQHSSYTDLPLICIEQVRGTKATFLSDRPGPQAALPSLSRKTLQRTEEPELMFRKHSWDRFSIGFSRSLENKDIYQKTLPVSARCANVAVETIPEIRSWQFSSGSDAR